MKKILVVTFMLLLAGPQLVMANEWNLDPAHSGFMFDIRHIYSITRGQFNEYSGKVYFDPAQPDKSRCEFAVEVDSIHTNIGKRDNHLRSSDFFDAKEYPLMTFKSSKVTPLGDNKYRLEGPLTIKDVTKDIAVELIYKGQTAHPFNKNQIVAGFETRFTIDRLAYTVGSGKLYNMGMLAKEVDVLVSMELIRDK